MGADYIVHRPCAPKLTFGAGDALKGTEAMMAMIKARSYAELLAQNAHGRDLASLSVTVRRQTPAGVAEEALSYPDLIAKAAPLEEHAVACRGCPANVLGTPYGCYGAVPYPVTAAAEKWLVSRLETAESPGGIMLGSAIRDFHYDGAPIAAMRARGLFELTAPAEKIVEKKLFSSRRVNGNQIFQAIFSVGGALGSGHSMMLLTFVGALAVGGRVPATRADGELLARIGRARTEAERRQVATLELGPPGEGPKEMVDLLRAVYSAWVLDVDLLMDA